MKTPSDELFLLIKALNTQEKVHFKKTQKSNRYLEVFDLIDHFSTYDEKKLKQSLAGKSYVKNLKFIKGYIFDAILTSLEDYHLINSADAILCRQIHQIKILIKKLLLNSAKKLTSKAETFALNNSKPNYLIIISSIKREIILTEMDLNKINNYRPIYDSELRSISELKNEADYYFLNVKILQIILTQFSISSKKNKELKSYLKNPLLKNENNALTFTSKILYYDTLGSIYYLLNNWQFCYNCYCNLILQYEQNSTYQKINSENYLVVANRLIVVMLRLKKINEIKQLYSKLEKFVSTISSKEKSSNLLRIYAQINVNLIDSYLQSCKFEEALTLSLKLETDIVKYSDRQSNILFNFNMTLIYFYQGDYKRALKYNNNIIHNNELNVRSDAILSSKIVNLIIHYELGNVDLLESISKSELRYFTKKGVLDDYYKILITFFIENTIQFNISSSQLDREKKKNAFIKLKKQLLLAKTNVISGDFEFITWIDTKIKNKKMLELMNEIL